MRRNTRTLATRVKALEGVREKRKLGHLTHQHNKVMEVNPMPPLDEWEHFTRMQQNVSLQRARYEGPEPDEVAHPYPAEYIEYQASRVRIYL